MQKNVNRIDRMIRIIAGLAISSLAFWGPTEPVYLLGLVLTFTGLIGFCPAYSLFGTKSCCCEHK